MTSPVSETPPVPPAPPWLKACQVALILIFAGLAYWQLARVDFDWRLALEGADPWVFAFAMATLPVFGFPISACYIYAGLAFSFWTGVASCLGALAINMSVSYFLMRGFLGRPLQAFLAKRRWRLPQPKGDNVFRFVFLVRTIPGPPFFFQNLALSLAGIPFFPYFWVSMLSQGTIAVGMVYFVGTLSRDPGGVGGIMAAILVGVVVIARTAQHLAKRFRGGDKKT